MLNTYKLLYSGVSLRSERGTIIKSVQKILLPPDHMASCCLLLPSRGGYRNIYKEHMLRRNYLIISMTIVIVSKLDHVFESSTKQR